MIPENLREFGFLHAWESFREWRISLGQPLPDPDEMLNYLSERGPTIGAAELWDLIIFEKSKLQKAKVAYSFDQSDSTNPNDFFL